MPDLKMANNLMKKFGKENRMPSRFFPERLCQIVAMILTFVAIFYGSGLQAAEKVKGHLSKASKVSPISSSSYELQLNSFKVKSNAKRFFNGLVKKGYKPFMVFVQKGEVWFKVRMGPYPSKKAAIQAAAELRKKHGLPSLILFAGEIQSSSKNVSKISSKRVASKNAGNSIDVVMSQFLVWLKAWQSKQLDSYFSFYSRNFENGGKPFKDWQKEQSKSLDEVQRIKVEIDDLEMLEKGDTIEMSFIERFQSKSFSDIRRKVLVWKNEKGVWKIIVESSEPA